jgi:hypothetical protein
MSFHIKRKRDTITETVNRDAKGLSSPLIVATVSLHLAIEINSFIDIHGEKCSLSQANRKEYTL